MMLRKPLLILFLLIAQAEVLPGANAAVLDAAYLTGKWEINADGPCGKADAEKLIVNDNATFEYGRRGKIEAVGFWRIRENVVVFEMLTSPAYFQDIANELKDYTRHEVYSMQMMPLDMQQERFNAVASIDDQMSRLVLQRCR
jgi:hypothetical protein